MSDSESQLVVGTAGHIDHGKSRLVHALTGTDPDRLPEEKARGMTIDLGFAFAELGGNAVYFVDVPGHERFIRNMVAGATGVDLALLVVAADDSVMPQTREHAELLSLLGIERCVVALTKMDLVDDEWAEQVEEEVSELLTRLDIEPVATVRTSAESGRGIDELRELLGRLAGEPKAAAPYAWFRMPVDRAFTIRGRGTVVTGTVAHGSIARETELELWRVGAHIGPTADARVDTSHLVRRVRVRDLQTHDTERDSATGRMRLAVNLAGVALDDARRGYELATPDYLHATHWLDVSLPWLRMPGKTRRKRLRVRLHIATSEVLAEVRLLHAPPTEGVYKGFAQLKTPVPIVATWGQRFIIRDESARRTLGGGRVLRCATRPWTARNPANEDALAALRDGSDRERVEEIIRGDGWETRGDASLSAHAGLPDAAAAIDARRRLLKDRRIVRMQSGSAEYFVHAATVKGAAQRVVTRLTAHLNDNPRLAGIPRSEWSGWMPRACPSAMRPALADWFIKSSAAAVCDGFVVPKGHQMAMSAEDQKLTEAMLAEFADGRFQPPAIDRLVCRTDKNAKRLRELIKLCEARGRLVSIAQGIWLHPDRHAEMVAAVTGAIRQSGGLTVGDIRTLLDSSRKFVVPIAEHLDKIQVTRREGDLRQLGSKSAAE